MDMTKQDGGTLTGWQFHTLTKDFKAVKKIRPDLEFKTDAVYKMSATVVEDPLGRWDEGWHMTSSIVLEIDLENMLVETANTIYHLEGEAGDVIPDLGPGIMSVFY